MIGLVSRMVRSVKMQIDWCNEDQEEEEGYLGQATPRSSRERAIVAILDERYAPKVRQAVPLRKETAAVRASEKKLAIQMTCCTSKFCSETCMQEAEDTYHNVICGKGFSWLHRACTEADQVYCDKIPLLLVKILATAVQQNWKPLRVSCIRTLKAETSSKSSKILLYAVPNSPSFLSDDLLVLETLRLGTACKLELADGGSVPDITHVARMHFTLGVHREELWGLGTQLGKFDVILGMPWLEQHNPHKDWAGRVMSLNSGFCLRKCLPGHRPVADLASLMLPETNYKPTPGLRLIDPIGGAFEGTPWRKRKSSIASGIVRICSIFSNDLLDSPFSTMHRFAFSITSEP
ncbi:hypothetical protein JMJ35_004600 [Cladonia borealis]|uniref:Uncharacterized protein n=1 Tax=Cladonia borealis TaxID=184061 RepID=A0AA39R0G2_9LECA|nr:hypothetical protein JMJ35_004600 [Cladonia borealis]